ncbi:MAG: VanZ family protein [Deltaproteobacteria bacterium]|nr:VanZ family protein [Deltaproteobacteria bacterium]
MKRIIKYWGPLVLYLAFIVWGSLTPMPEELPEIWEIDKVYHLGAYAIMGGLWVRAMRGGEGIKSSRAVLLAGSFAFLFGAAIEVLQSFVPERNSDIIDGMVNGAGGIIGAIIFNRFLSFMGQSSRRRI